MLISDSRKNVRNSSKNPFFDKAGPQHHTLIDISLQPIK